MPSSMYLQSADLHVKFELNEGFVAFRDGNILWRHDITGWTAKLGKERLPLVSTHSHAFPTELTIVGARKTAGVFYDNTPTEPGHTIVIAHEQDGHEVDFEAWTHLSPEHAKNFMKQLVNHACAILNSGPDYSHDEDGA